MMTISTAIQTQYTMSNKVLANEENKLQSEETCLTELPANLLHAFADAVRVDDHGNVQEQEVSTRTLGTRTVLETFNSVESLERRETPGEEDAEEVDGHDD